MFVSFFVLVFLLQVSFREDLNAQTWKFNVDLSIQSGFQEYILARLTGETCGFSPKVGGLI
jgi:hypothetical protein